MEVFGKLTNQPSSRKWLAYTLLGVGFLLAATGLRIFSYLGRSFTSPFSVLNQPNNFSDNLKMLEGQVDGLVWLAPLLLLLGGWSLLAKNSGKVITLPTFSTELKADLVAGIILLAGTLLRLLPLLPPNWLEVKADYDEGVYMMATHLLTNGYSPYRDFFLAHPPSAIYGFVPAALLGGESANLIWLARFTTVLWSAGIGWLVWLIGR